MSNLSKFLAVGATAFTGWLMYESKKGHAPEWERKVVVHELNNNYEDVSSGWALYSGHPTLDKWAHRMHVMGLRGPFGIFETFAKLKTYAEGYINDVILANLLPAAVSVGLLYHGFGAKTIHEPFRRFKQAIGPAWSRVHFTTRLWNGVCHTAGGAGKVAYYVGSKAAKNPVAALAVTGLTGFFLNRFSRVMDHTEQEAFFRDSITGADSH